jgi:hypothetical protein
MHGFSLNPLLRNHLGKCGLAKLAQPEDYEQNNLVLTFPVIIN